MHKNELDRESDEIRNWNTQAAPQDESERSVRMEDGQQEHEKKYATDSHAAAAGFTAETNQSGRVDPNRVSENN